jgi:L-lactate utilization protein LutC
VLLTGASADRRALLRATRVIVTVRRASIVADPIDLDTYIDGQDALLLTGASRTADIEKQIVRGIHGADAIVVVLR